MTEPNVSHLYQQVRRYHSDGRVGNAPVLVPLIGGIATMVLAVVYGYASAYNPFPGIITVALAVIYGVGLGFTVSYACKLSYCRSSAFAIGLSLIIALFAVYCVFTVFVFAVLQREGNLAADDTLLGLFTAPQQLWQELNEINQRGWQTRASKATGFAAWAYWTAETLLIVAITVGFGADASSQCIYCEHCGRWCTHYIEGWALLQAPEDTAVLTRLKDGDLTPLETLPLAETEAPGVLRIDGWSCRNCDDTVGVTIHTLVTRQVGKKDKTDAQKLGHPVLVPMALCEYLGKRFSRD